MSRIINLLLFASLFNFLTSCNGQTKDNPATIKNTDTKKLVGGGCDGCEIMFVGMPTNISSVDTSAGWTEKGQKLYQRVSQHIRTEFDAFYPLFSEPIIDEIDTVLAKHYGFTDEELDFIINYDIKYRMGKELSEPGFSQDDEDEQD